MKHRHRCPWTLAKLVAECSSAPAVFLALCELAAERGSHVTTPTRAILSLRTGLSAETISKGLTALESAGWVSREHVPVKVGNVQTATLLRIVLLRRAESFRHTKPTAVERKVSAKGRAESFRQDLLRKRRLPVAPAGEPAPRKQHEQPEPEGLAPLDPKTKIPLAILEAQKQLRAPACAEGAK